MDLPKLLAVVRAKLTERRESSTTAVLSIKPDTIGPQDVPFLLGANQERMRSSLAASFAGHMGAVGLVLFLMSLAPEQVYDLIEPNRENYGIVFLPQDGPGGGGGGGGNQSLEMPGLVELEGADETELSD